MNSSLRRKDAYPGYGEWSSHVVRKRRARNLKVSDVLRWSPQGLLGCEIAFEWEGLLNATVEDARTKAENMVARRWRRRVWEKTRRRGRRRRRWMSQRLNRRRRVQERSPGTRGVALMAEVDAMASFLSREMVARP